jgi:hypothetical protein
LPGRLCYCKHSLRALINLDTTLLNLDAILLNLDTKPNQVVVNRVAYSSEYSSELIPSSSALAVFSRIRQQSLQSTTVSSLMAHEPQGDNDKSNSDSDFINIDTLLEPEAQLLTTRIGIQRLEETLHISLEHYLHVSIRLTHSQRSKMIKI